MKKSFLSFAPILLSSLLFSGCTTTVTNLTPSTQRRNPNGLYPFEVVLDTRQHSIRRDSIKPFVLVCGQSYPMEPTLSLKNRWETLVPLPGDKEYVSYRFKFDYDSNSLGGPTPGSKLSRPFQVHITDK